MAQSVKFTIFPSDASDGALSARDVADHLLDILELLGFSESPFGENTELVWRLKSASTNSPLTIEVEAFGGNPTIPIERQARRAAAVFASGAAMLGNGEVASAWNEEPALKVVKRFAKRMMNGIGRVDFSVQGVSEKPVTVAHKASVQVLVAIERSELDRRSREEDYTHAEYGSVEGFVTGLRQYNNKPALSLLTRIDGREIPCVFSKEDAERVGLSKNWDDAWRKRRVLVHGRLHFDAAGRVHRVSANEVDSLPEATADLRALRSKEWSYDLSPAEYIENLRAGNLG